MVVTFKARPTNIELKMFCGGLLDAPKEVTANHRNDPLLTFHLLPTHHCVRLASARLAVGKDANVVAGKYLG